MRKIPETLGTLASETENCLPGVFCTTSLVLASECPAEGKTTPSGALQTPERTRGLLATLVCSGCFKRGMHVTWHCGHFFFCIAVPGKSLKRLPSLWSPDLFCTSRLRRSQIRHSLCCGEFCKVSYKKQQGVRGFLETMKSTISFPSATIIYIRSSASPKSRLPEIKGLPWGDSCPACPQAGEFFRHDLKGKRATFLQDSKLLTVSPLLCKVYENFQKHNNKAKMLRP